MPNETSMGGARRSFEPTRWSLILQVRQGSRTPSGTFGVSAMDTK